MVRLYSERRMLYSAQHQARCIRKMFHARILIALKVHVVRGLVLVLGSNVHLKLVLRASRYDLSSCHLQVH